jgi:hypothetical protein
MFRHLIARDRAKPPLKFVAFHPETIFKSSSDPS